MDELMSEWGLAGLFISAFLSSTLLPGSSEALLLALAIKASHAKSVLLVVATSGNTLGGMTSWLLGWWLARRYAPEKIAEHQYETAIARVRRWGSPVLLFSWLPVIGDPLCVAAGWLRIHPLLSLVMITLGKGARYAVLLWLAA